MDSKLIIGVGGQIGNGKDTFADYLVTKINSRYEKPNDVWIRNAFAHLVKNIFQTAFNVDREFVEKWKRINEPPENFLLPVRDCLINIGDGFRKMNGNVWIDNVLRQQKEHEIIADCRYINETITIKERNGISILLWRPGFENQINNASEQEYTKFIETLKPLDFDGAIPKNLDIPFDLWIRNDGTIEDLHRKIDEIVVPYIDEFWGFKKQN
jgi:hypothetical protein